MDGKITLITPPDFFENTNKSILFLHINDQDQETVSKWLSNSKLKEDLNFYVYNNEDNIGWLLYALSRCDYKYIDVEGENFITQRLLGYMMGKNNFYYKTNDPNTVAVYSHINQNHITDINQFLENLNEF